jgi:putative redox protein
MKITLETAGNLNRYSTKNDEGQEVLLGNDGTTARPMQGLLMALAGCSTIDVVMILEKMRQDLKDVKVEVEGTRREEVPRIFTAIHLHYKIYGDVKEAKAARAIELSTTKYCSVSKMIDSVAKVTTSFEIIAD